MLAAAAMSRPPSSKALACRASISGAALRRQSCHLRSSCSGVIGSDGEPGDAVMVRTRLDPSVRVSVTVTGALPTSLPCFGGVFASITCTSRNRAWICVRSTAASVKLLRSIRPSSRLARTA